MIVTVYTQKFLLNHKVTISIHVSVFKFWFRVNMGMKSEFLKYGFCLKFNILISDEECLDAENVESYRIIVRFTILCLKTWIFGVKVA